MESTGDDARVVDLEKRVPQDHPARTIKPLAGGVLKRLSREVRLDACAGGEGRLRLLEHWRGQALIDAVALEAERKSLCAGAAG